MDIKINDYYEPEHFKALNEADYDVSHSCDYEKMQCTTFMNPQRF